MSTPFDANSQLKKNNGDPVAQSKYAHIIGSLMHLINFTRPDIAYVVCRLTRYTHNPNREHWSALARLMKYLRGTMNYGILYSGFPFTLEGYSDANWISDSDETKSTSDYVFTLCGGTISWKSAKQTIIARSTMESEFVALELAGSKDEWLRNFLTDIPLIKDVLPHVSIHCDCQAAIVIAKNKSYNCKSRHMKLRHDVIKQLLRDGIIFIDYVKSEVNLADPLTKPMGRKLILQTSKRWV
ncbi:secreted RxLR effector protein 161-like [Nicotiana tabacum]|uniref:Secreted RxLR effector protein 161-like n=1 Tax=Nicotiana tabacum TaxID=4097 RepID=A0AC58SY63_TOBAC